MEGLFVYEGTGWISHKHASFSFNTRAKANLLGSYVQQVVCAVLVLTECLWLDIILPRSRTRRPTHLQVVAPHLGDERGSRGLLLQELLLICFDLGLLVKGSVLLLESDLIL